jgi:hypothetical protein
MINDPCATINIDCLRELVRVSAIEVSDLHDDCDDAVAIARADRDIGQLRHRRVAYRRCRCLGDV